MADLALAWLCGLAGLVGLGLQLPKQTILPGMGLLAVVGVYFLLQHGQRTRTVAGATKEVMGGGIFAVGALFFVWLQMTWSAALMAGSLAWAGLCGLNCLCIARWDCSRDAVMKQDSLAQLWAGSGIADFGSGGGVAGNAGGTGG